MVTHKTAIILSIGALTFAAPVFAQEAKNFSDFSSSDFGYSDVQALVAKGIIKGYDDGTFKPNAKVNRAEALKILSAQLITSDEESAKVRSDYTDTPNDAWYLPYLAWAAKNEVVNPATKSSKFRPTDPVTRVEFLKMLFKAHDVDTNAFGEVQLPLSSDVTNPKEWYYPYMRYALSSAVSIAPTTELLTPNRELTRTDVAVLVNRYLQFKAGTRTQTLLDQASDEIENTLDALEKNDLKRAEYASVRALLASRGAHEVKPDEAAVKVAVKTTEAIRALVRAFKSATDGNIDDVIKLSQDAWYIADQARQISPSATTIADQIKTYSKTFADSARKRTK